MKPRQELYLHGVPSAQSQPETIRASLNDVPHKTSLPSTEVTGAGTGEHVGGVGSLPGTVAESGVARLPDEVPTLYNESSTGSATGVGVGGAAGAVDSVIKKVEEQGAYLTIVIQL